MSQLWYWISYCGIGLLVVILSLPFLRGRDASPGFGGGLFFHIFGWVLLWPFLAIASTWIGMLRYRCYWVDYLSFCDETANDREDREFNDRWMGASDDTKINLDYQRQHKELLSRKSERQSRINRRQYYLEEQARKGIWFKSKLPGMRGR